MTKPNDKGMKKIANQITSCGDIDHWKFFHHSIFDCLYYRIAYGVCPEFYGFSASARALWRGNGRRMGTGCIPGDGNFADRRARVVLGNFAARLCVRLSAGGARLWNCVSVFRMARIVRRRCVAGIFGHLHSRACAGITRVAEAKIDRELLVEPRRSCEAALVAFSLRDLVDDGVQRDVAWNAGP